MKTFIIKWTNRVMLFEEDIMAEDSCEAFGDWVDKYIDDPDYGYFIVEDIRGRN